VLRRISRHSCAQVAILSGRSLGDLRRRVRLPDIFLAGAAGLETLSPGRAPEVHVPRGRGLPLEARRRVRAWCRRFPATWVEDKRLSLALHYRDLDPRRVPTFAAGVARVARRFHDHIDLVRGKKVFELMPAVGRDKAAALRTWSTGAAGGLLFFVGDDANDEPAHAFARARGAITVAVGRRRSLAEYALPDTEHVTWFLEWLLLEWRSRHHGGC
jgi:trehalose-phosphatase